MSFLSAIIDTFFWLYIHGLLYQTETFIDDLQITPNPDSYLIPPMMIRRNGYPAETYTIRTPDGFILALDRIPNTSIREKTEENKFPILLIHGYLDSSFAFVAEGPDGALAYLLADQGYDIWMINTRGNKFSQGHANYTPQEKAFWDFSFHEIGVYDIPTAIDFILKKTNQKQLFCIGDSAGNTVFYIMLSVLPQYNEKIIAQVSVAPYYHESPSLIIALIKPIVDDLLEYLYQHTPGAFLTRDLLTKFVIKILTTVQFFGYSLYDFVLLIGYLWLPSNIDWEIMPNIENNFPSGTSVKATQHLLQMEYSFSYFDYGPEENVKTYGTNSPPKYNISNIHVPVRIYHSLLDIAASLKDVHSLYDKLPIKAGLISNSDPEFTHLDNEWNKNAKKLLYNDIIKFVNDVSARIPQ